MELRIQDEGAELRVWLHTVLFTIRPFFSSHQRACVCVCVCGSSQLSQLVSVK